jgi:hypothetical protein
MNISPEEVAFHILLIDIIKYIFKYILIPFFALFVLYVFKIHRKILYNFIRLRNWIDGRKLQSQFDEIFENEEENNLRSQYIKNALVTARSNNKLERVAAIKQLSQFNEPIVSNELLQLLCNEEDVAMKRILISALNKVTW